MKFVHCFFIFMSTLLFGKENIVDVVIPCVEKDLYTLEKCIEHAKQNLEGVRRVIVVSPKKYTDNAEWFDESKYPFSKDDVNSYLGKVDTTNYPRIGWYYQQLLKIYAPFIIPDISDNVLILDADTMILKKLPLFDEKNRPMIWVNERATTIREGYERHMKRLFPNLEINVKNVDPIVNAMLFQKEVLHEMITNVEERLKKPFWQAFSEEVYVHPKNNWPGRLGASEYVVYFFYMTNYRKEEFCQYGVKLDNWMISLDYLDKDKKEGYEMASCHSYLHNKTVEINPAAAAK